jgi:hypothetical protein
VQSADTKGEANPPAAQPHPKIPGPTDIIVTCPRVMPWSAHWVAPPANPLPTEACLPQIRLASWHAAAAPTGHVRKGRGVCMYYTRPPPGPPPLGASHGGADAGTGQRPGRGWRTLPQEGAAQGGARARAGARLERDSRATPVRVFHTGRSRCVLRAPLNRMRTSGWGALVKLRGQGFECIGGASRGPAQAQSPSLLGAARGTLSISSTPSGVHPFRSLSRARRAAGIGSL